MPAQLGAPVGDEFDDARGQLLERTPGGVEHGAAQAAVERADLVELVVDRRQIGVATFQGLQAHARDALHGRAAFTKGEKPPFHTPLDNFAKLRLWQLDYARVVFIDADALVLQNVDRLFDYPQFCAAPNVYESVADFHRLNSGVFTARPDAATFADMLARLDQPGAFWRRTDQTFLEHAYPDWHGLPVFCNMLQYVWFNLPELWSWTDIKVLHFQYEKPWQEHAKADRLRPLIDLWRAYASGDPVPDSRTLPGP